MVKGITGVQRSVTNELEHGAMQRVGAGLGASTELPARVPPQLGRILGRVERELLDGVRVGVYIRRLPRHVHVAHAVEHVDIVLAAIAVDDGMGAAEAGGALIECRGRIYDGSAGYDEGELGDVPAVQRQVLDAARVDGLGKLRRVSIGQFRLGLYVHSGGYRAESQLDVAPHTFIGPHRDARDPGSDEAGLGHIKGVSARHQLRRHVVALLAGHHHGADAGCGCSNLYLRIGDSASAGVRDGSEQARFLAETGYRNEKSR